MAKIELGSTEHVEIIALVEQLSGIKLDNFAKYEEATLTGNLKISMPVKLATRTANAVLELSFV